MPEVNVSLVLAAQDQIGRGGGDITDEKGHFNIASVMPGSYVLVLNEKGTKSSSEPFSTLYYPGVTDREKAAVITVRLGEFVKDLKVVVPAVQETVTVAGVVRYANNKPAAEKWVGFRAVAEPGVKGDVDTYTHANGRYSIKILKGLKGEIYSTFPPSPRDYSHCPKLKNVIKKSGQEHMVFKTQVIKIDAERNVDNLFLTFPVSTCRPKK